jgi:hypothetical protein
MGCSCAQGCYVVSPQQPHACCKCHKEVGLNALLLLSTNLSENWLDCHKEQTGNAPACNMHCISHCSAAVAYCERRVTSGGRVTSSAPAKLRSFKPVGSCCSNLPICSPTGTFTSTKVSRCGVAAKKPSASRAAAGTPKGNNMEQSTPVKKNRIETS